MSVHNVTWYATASGLGSTEVIEGALNWLTGGNAEISREKVKSYHGARMMMLRAQIDRKKAARESIPYMGAQILDFLAQSEDLISRIDEENVLHIRLSISSLVRGSIELSEGSEEQVKGRIKLEVYPGQNPLENAREMLAASAVRATELGLPSPLQDSE
ncbi:MAG: RNA-binding domain-containing protein [Candidatus Thermoplasmatota archaeon]|nr:RNA-binding domain-containing protein [Candidatus Thermoplasmatota archaeon]